MKIVRPYAKITKDSHAHIPLAGMKHIEWCSRISHRSEDAQKEDSWKRFIQAVVIEHGITHEVVRHRLFSFTQESTRFVNYEKKMSPSFIYPKPEVECEYCLAGEEVSFVHEYLDKDVVREFGHDIGPLSDTGPFPMGPRAACAYGDSWLRSINLSERSYIELLKSGWRPQEARSVFPNALASRIIVTGNLRNWRHFFNGFGALEPYK